MRQTETPIPGLLDKLEKFYGKQEPCWPVDPYEFLVWWHCGYPASDTACTKGWENLKASVDITPMALLKAPQQTLSSALRAGGMVPDLRALRLKEIAMRVQDEFGGDLRMGLTGAFSEVRKTLKTFPGIADPGADRILLFAGIKPIAAVPSNCTQVLPRIIHGHENENYVASYREAQQLLSIQLAETFDSRTRAYQLLKRHGQDICKRAKPKCGTCPVSLQCAFFAAQSAEQAIDGADASATRYP
jgi:endonuclease III